MNLPFEGGMALGRVCEGLIAAPSVEDLEINGLCHDSREVHPGNLFVALAGTRSHGMKHAGQAVARGAVAVVYDPALGGSELAEAQDLGNIPCLAVDGLGQNLGLIANRFYGEPSSHLSVVGITGTNGKTSCSHYLAYALNTNKTSVIGTLGWGVPGELRPTAHTTPDAIQIHAMLARLLAMGITDVAVEASSHGLDQGRLNGVRFQGGLFTNLSRDHLDYHGDMATYLSAKLRLAEWPGLQFMVFNLDDESAPAIMDRIPNGVRKIGFTTRTSDREPTCEVLGVVDVDHGESGLEVHIQFAGKTARVLAPLYGDFNVDNLLGVAGVLLAKGYALEDVAGRLSRVRAVEGRMERFGGGSLPTVVVDYAHSPDALRKSLESLRHHCRGRLAVVFGCGGDRDRGKRPQMGEIATRLADKVWLTDDNPRFEEGDAIVRQILEACRADRVVVERDRRLAISQAIAALGSADVLLVAGKGHEDSQEIAGVKYPFSDREVVRQCLGLSEVGA